MWPTIKVSPGRRWSSAAVSCSAELCPMVEVRAWLIRVVMPWWCPQRTTSSLVEFIRADEATYPSYYILLHCMHDAYFCHLHEPDVRCAVERMRWNLWSPVRWLRSRSDSCTPEAKQ